MKVMKKFCLLLMLIVGFSVQSHAITNAEAFRILRMASVDVNKGLPSEMGEGMTWDSFSFNESGSRGVPELVFKYRMTDYTGGRLGADLMSSLRPELIKVLKEELKDGMGEVTVADMRRMRLAVKVIFTNSYRNNVGELFFSSSDMF